MQLEKNWSVQQLEIIRKTSTIRIPLYHHTAFHKKIKSKVNVIPSKDMGLLKPKPLQTVNFAKYLQYVHVLLIAISRSLSPTTCTRTCKGSTYRSPPIRMRVFTYLITFRIIRSIRHNTCWLCYLLGDFSRLSLSRHQKTAGRILWPFACCRR